MTSAWNSADGKPLKPGGGAQTVSRVGVVTKAHPQANATLNGKLFFHNPCPPGDAALRNMTTTKVCGLPVRAKGPTFNARD
jgi:hypothetical protein